MIYLDGDILVRDDLGPLWERPMNGNIALGVPDFRSPTVAQRLSLRDAYLEDLGLPSDTVYCNTGMMVIDLTASREEEVGPQCIEFVRKYGHLVEYADQDALNGVIAGRWKVLDPTWQVALSALHYYGFPNHESSENRREQARLKRKAKIVHYSGASKPRHFLYRRSLSAEFFDYFVETGWFEAWKARLWTWPRRLAHVTLRLLPDTALDMAGRALTHVKTRLK